MNSINFDKNDFPLTTTVLGFMQSSAALIEQLTALVGGNYILSGGVKTGTSVSPGFVVIDNQVMPFTGGTLQQYVRVVTSETEITVQDSKYTRTEKNLVFGSGSGQFEYSSLRRASDLLTMIENIQAEMPNKVSCPDNEKVIVATVGASYTLPTTHGIIIIDSSALSGEPCPILLPTAQKNRILQIKGGYHIIRNISTHAHSEDRLQKADNEPTYAKWSFAKSVWLGDGIKWHYLSGNIVAELD
jgi:hypothetical protein